MWQKCAVLAMNLISGHDTAEDEVEIHTGQQDGPFDFQTLKEHNKGAEMNAHVIKCV
jgi:hypothetical protein